MVTKIFQPPKNEQQLKMASNTSRLFFNIWYKKFQSLEKRGIFVEHFLSSSRITCTYSKKPVLLY